MPKNKSIDIEEYPTVLEVRDPILLYIHEMAALVEEFNTNTELTPKERATLQERMDQLGRAQRATKGFRITRITLPTRKKPGQ